MTSVNDISKYVLAFLQDAECDKDTIESWKSTKVQKRLRSRCVTQQKDPNAPKKARSAYLFYCSDEREAIKKEDSELNSKEITVELGVRWNILKESTKSRDKKRHAKFSHLAEEDRDRYLSEKAEYTPPANLQLLTGGRKKKDPNAPKRGKSSYIFFCAAERESVNKDNPEMAPKEITRELGRRWNELKESFPKKVAKYVKLAEKDKERYLTEKAKYESSGSDSGSTENDEE